MNPFLAASDIIDFDHPLVAAKARELAATASNERELASACFLFVRDAIRHSGDYQQNPVTLSASEVLQHGTGFCYAKSHLLAALLRANHIPAGFCYQRLSVNDASAPWCLHGLNAVFLTDLGWYRCDARGNKPGMAAEFTPPVERLAFAIRETEERDLPEIWPEPLPVVVESLRACHDVAELGNKLPDILLLDA